MQVNKKYIPWLSMLFLLQSGVTITHSQTTWPVINEVVSANITGIPDEYEADVSNCPVPDCVQWYKDLGESVYDGDYPDWIELYTPSADAINLAGYGLSDNPAIPFKWVFPDIVLAPGGY